MPAGCALTASAKASAEGTLAHRSADKRWVFKRVRAGRFYDAIVSANVKKTEDRGQSS
jgi:hypothetical protein